MTGWYRSTWRCHSLRGAKAIDLRGGAWARPCAAPAHDRGPRQAGWQGWLRAAASQLQREEGGLAGEAPVGACVDVSRLGRRHGLDQPLEGEAGTEDFVDQGRE